MKRNTFIIWFALVVIIALNAILFYSIYKMQVNQQKNLLFRETEVCSQELEKALKKFESDLNYILFSDDISELFLEEESNGLRKLLFFYSTYHDLIKNVDIYDNEKNVLNVFRDRKKNFITDRYIAQRQRKLLSKEEIIKQKEDYQYVLPVFKDKELFANVLITINLNNFVFSSLEKFHIEGYSWQWILDIDNQLIYNANNIGFVNFEASEDIFANLNRDLSGMKIHSVSNDSLNYKFLTVFAPVKVINMKFGIAMSLDYKSFLFKLFSKLALISFFSLVVFVLVSVYFLRQISALKKKIKA